MKKYFDASALRFLVAGVANTAITYVIYVALLRTMAYGWAFTLAFLLGILLSYLFNAVFVFRKPIAVRTLLRFPLVYVAQYLGGLCLLAILVDAAGVPSWLAPLFVLVVTIPLTYLLSRAVFSAGRNA